jgi:hypothetical protein
VKTNDSACIKNFAHLADRMTQMDQRLTARIDSLETQMNIRFDYVEKKMKSIVTSMQLMIGAMVTVSTGIIVMLIQINMNISSL